MSSRFDWYFRQRVTEEELDRAFDQLEQADRDLASDLSVFGIISGAVATPHQPVPDLRIDITGPARAYDRLGRRIFVPVHATVDLERDLNGLPTQVVTPGNERWLSVSMRFARSLSDPRIDGNGAQVFFRRDESFEFVVRQGAEVQDGDASRPPLAPDELLVCDVRRTFGQVQIEASDIDAARRQKFFFAQAESVGVQAADWYFAGEARNVQDALGALDQELHFHETGQSRRHHAIEIQCNPSGFLDGVQDVDGALSVITSALAANAPSAAGSRHIGADGVSGTPFSLSQGTVDGQLSSLLGHLNGHQKSSAAHTAEQISATATSYITGATVQAQLTEIVNDLAGQSPAASGADRIGCDGLPGSPNNLQAASVRAQLFALLNIANGHANAESGAAHPASTISVADANNRLNATTVEASLNEVLAAFEGGHLRGNETNPGQHRTIVQPSFGGNQALLWDARGTGNSPRLRVYLESDGLILTLNAARGDSGWTKDTGGYASALKLTRDDLKLHQSLASGSTFVDWVRSWTLKLDTAGTWRVSGAAPEQGRVAIWGQNTSNASFSMTCAQFVNFKVQYQNVPSDITFTVNSRSVTFPDPPGFTLQRKDQNGFFLLRQSLTFPANTFAYWDGWYDVVA